MAEGVRADVILADSTQVPENDLCWAADGPFIRPKSFLAQHGLAVVADIRVP
jgi:hypothetical protein